MSLNQAFQTRRHIHRALSEHFAHTPLTKRQPACQPEELCQQALVMLELVLEQAGLAKGWANLYQCATHNHLHLMRTRMPQGTALQEGAYLTACLDYADRLRSAPLRTEDAQIGAA